MDGRLTILHVLEAGDASAHDRAVREWAADVWDAWTPHHDTVRSWVRTSLGG